MKKNWVKGLDRIAILLAVPVFLIGAFYSSKKFSERKGVVVYSCENDLEKARAIFDALPKGNKDFYLLIFPVDGPKRNGVLANGAEELTQRRNESMLMDIALSRAIEDGGDPKGTLVNKKTFGVDVGADHVDLCLIPNQWKRWAVGIVGGIGFSIATLFGIGLSTRYLPRLFHWVREGFISR